MDKIKVGDEDNLEFTNNFSEILSTGYGIKVEAEMDAEVIVVVIYNKATGNTLISATGSTFVEALVTAHGLLLHSRG